MSDNIVVARRFHGPPNSGNGGYVCGLAARFIDGPAEVTLRAPPPLETALNVVRSGDGVSLRDGDRDIAVARPATANVTPPPSPSFAEAERAAQHYRGFKSHIFPGCFVCGTARAEGDGLRLFAGAVDDRALVATPWRPSADLAAADGRVAPEFLWAALDCPSYWSLPDAGARSCVLGRLTASIDQRPAPGDALIVAAWPLGADGRKHRAATAIYNSAGAVLARAEAVWVEIKPEQFA